MSKLLSRARAVLGTLYDYQLPENLLAEIDAELAAQAATQGAGGEGLGKGGVTDAMVDSAMRGYFRFHPDGSCLHSGMRAALETALSEHPPTPAGQDALLAAGKALSDQANNLVCAIADVPRIRDSDTGRCLDEVVNKAIQLRKSLHEALAYVSASTPPVEGETT